MPAVPLAVNLVARSLILTHRQTPPSPYPPFHRLNNDDDDDDDDDNDNLNSLESDLDDALGRLPLGRPRDGDDGLSGGTIAAIVISVVVFLVVVVGLALYFRWYRRRKARKEIVEIALKEDQHEPATAPVSPVETGTAAAAATTRAHDPPPPYDEVRGQAGQAGQGAGLQQQQQALNASRGVEEEEDAEAIGSHATITDGLAPARPDLAVK